ncbi:hypothetical protein SAMN05878494_0939 [Bacillus cereus]|nr:hypothetical protein SAMN05878494_0939 [Bacillus cereus]
MKSLEGNYNEIILLCKQGRFLESVLFYDTGFLICFIEYRLKIRKEVEK